MTLNDAIFLAAFNMQHPDGPWPQTIPVKEGSTVIITRDQMILVEENLTIPAHLRSDGLVWPGTALDEQRIRHRLHEIREERQRLINQGNLTEEADNALAFAEQETSRLHIEKIQITKKEGE